MLRDTTEVLEDLKKLIYTPGYIYSLCLILFEDFHFDLNKIHEVDYMARLSVKECSLIIGFLVQKEIDFSYPESPELTFTRKEQTYELMEELHMSLNAPQWAKLRNMMEKQEKGEVIDNNWEERLDFFVKDKGLLEPMFYAGDGVYDFQYVEYLKIKYKYDNEWLLKNKGFDINIIPDIISTIKKLALERAEKVLPINVRDVFPQVAAKARKKMKKKFSKEEIDKIEREQLIAFSFYRYNKLFPDPEISNNSDEGWKSFYKNLLELFIIRPTNLTNINSESVDNFFRNFSFIPLCNESYLGPGHYNVLNSRPLIDLGGQRYMLPIGYLLPEATYESPFYWMLDDKQYSAKHAKHRGDVGEEIAYELLSKVFGEENTYKSVIIETKKGESKTDIDVLCLLDNKALCVQVKSKRLTLNAKRGDYDQLSKDFKGAIQDAYNQGLVSRVSLLNGKAKFVDTYGRQLDIPQNINEVYIMGLTTENYPTLVQQVHTMLVKKTDEPFPLFVSVFDLELLVHYLKDPYDFLYYVRQRIKLIEYFRADEEIVYLGYHLKKKLWPLEGADLVTIPSSFGRLIDRNYYPYKTDVLHLLPKKDDPISNQWKDPQFDLFVKAIKSTGYPNTTDIVFHLLDWSEDARKDIVAQMIKFKNASRQERTMKSIATRVGSDFGLSYVITPHTNPAELESRTVTYAQLRKYLCKSSAWLGLGAYSTSPNLIDSLIYLDDPWIQNQELEKAYKEELSHMKTSRSIPINVNKKIGRNDPCPCKSGKKFKNCCI